METRFSRRKTTKGPWSCTPSLLFFAEAGESEYIEDYWKNAAKSGDDKKWDATMATAYANRSASNFYLGHFKACLEDIDISLLCGYSKDSEHKLYERQGKCYVKLGCYQKALLSYEKASQSLEYCSDSAKKEKLKDLFEKELETCQNNTQVEITETNIKGNIFHGEIPVFKSEDRNKHFPFVHNCCLYAGKFRNGAGLSGYKRHRCRGNSDRGETILFSCCLATWKRYTVITAAAELSALCLAADAAMLSTALWDVRGNRGIPIINLNVRFCQRCKKLISS